MSKNPVVHFEMPYDDHARLAKFYEDAFGWKMNALGPEMGGYVMAHTAETDENMMVTTPGTINGGFFDRSQSATGGTSVVIAVDDIAATVKAVTAAGGKVIAGPMPIPGIGDYIAFTDSEGNTVGALQPAPMG